MTHFLKRTQSGLFWFLSIAVAIISYRFVVLGMEVGFPNMAHQLVSANIMFYLHVISAPIALVVAPFQLSERFRTKSVRRHRLLGRIYCAAVFLGGISGTIIGFSAMHGPVAQTGFVVLAIIWMFVTIRAVDYVRRGQIALHREWMIRSIALTFAGVMLRVWLPAQLVLGVPFDVAYQVVAWLCWVPNALIAEYLIRMTRKPKRIVE